MLGGDGIVHDEALGLCGVSAIQQPWFAKPKEPLRLVAFNQM